MSWFDIHPTYTSIIIFLIATGIVVWGFAFYLMIYAIFSDIKNHIKKRLRHAKK